MSEPGLFGTFFSRIDYLSEQVGHGTLRAQLVVDQVYAKYQHERPDLHHPRGGQAYYLRDPLYAHLDEYMEALAVRLVTPDGSDLKGAMRDIAENLSEQVETHAPREFGDLESSGHPTVTDDGAVIYDRPPITPRLSETELRLKHRGLVHRGSSRAVGIRRRRRLGPK